MEAETMDYRNDSLAQSLYSYLQSWLGHRPTWAYDSSGWMMTLKSIDSLSSDFMNDVEFNEINLAGLFRSPDGELIETVVGWILPWPTSLEFKLLVDAINAAAKAKQRNQRGVAAGLTFLAGALLFAMFSSE
jgi:hypothetical protein